MLERISVIPCFVTRRVDNLRTNWQQFYESRKPLSQEEYEKHLQGGSNLGWNHHCDDCNSKY